MKTQIKKNWTEFKKMHKLTGRNARLTMNIKQQAKNQFTINTGHDYETAKLAQQFTTEGFNVISVEKNSYKEFVIRFGLTSDKKEVKELAAKKVNEELSKKILEKEQLIKELKEERQFLKDNKPSNWDLYISQDVKLSKKIKSVGKALAKLKA